MRGTMLFPYDLNLTSQASYFFAIELARKLNTQLKVISTYEPASEQYTSDGLYSNNIEEFKSNLHLRLLQLNGMYNTKFDQWKFMQETKVKVLVKQGSLANVLLSQIRYKTANLILCDYYTFRQILIPFGLFNQLPNSTFRIGVIPQEVDDIYENPNKQNEIFTRYIQQCKLYNFPNDLKHINSEYYVQAKS